MSIFHGEDRFFGPPKVQEAYNIIIFLFLMENSILKIFGSLDVKITPEFCSWNVNSFWISLCEVLLGCNINCLELNQFQDRFLCRQKSSIFSTRFTKTLEWIPKATSIRPKLIMVYKNYKDWKGFEFQRLHTEKPW